VWVKEFWKDWKPSTTDVWQYAADAGLLASFPCKLDTFRNRVKNVATSRGIVVGIECKYVECSDVECSDVECSEVECSDVECSDVGCSDVECSDV
jgi:hypothetical protein